MNLINDVLRSAAPVVEDAVWFAAPEGYVPLPTDHISQAMTNSMMFLRDIIVEEEQQDALVALCAALRVFLEDLAASNVVYCGVGRHLAAEAKKPITSSLTVACQRFDDEERNPKILLKNLLEEKAESGQRGQAEIVEIDDLPVLFFETTRELPNPWFPGQPEVSEGALNSVFQLQAVVPSENGTRMATIDLSTPFADHGPEYRAMIVMMAMTVSFDPPIGSARPANPIPTSIESALG